MKIVSFLIAFVIFSIVILFHELGHFLLAKANGIRVMNFVSALDRLSVGYKKAKPNTALRHFRLEEPA